MILQKKVSGGILLYTLLMLAVFSFLLQFYLRNQNALAQEHMASRNSSQAYLMAQLTRDNVDLKNASNQQGKLVFTDGESRYQQTDQQLEVVVSLKSGPTYQYFFPLYGEKSEIWYHKYMNFEKSRGTFSVTYITVPKTLI